MRNKKILKNRIKNSILGTMGILAIVSISAPFLSSCGNTAQTIQESKAESRSLPIISIDNQPSDLNTSFGSSATFKVVASVTNIIEGTSLTYQWFSITSPSDKNPIKISGATNSSYTIDACNTTGNFYYYCEVSYSNALTVVSRTLKLTVNSKITITSQSGDISVNPSANTTLTIDAIIDNDKTKTLSYQWYRSSLNSTQNGIKIEYANSNTFVATADSTAGVSTYYYCVVSYQSISTTSTIINVFASFTTPTADAQTALTNYLNNVTNQKQLLLSAFAKDNNFFSVIMKDQYRVNDFYYDYMTSDFKCDLVSLDYVFKNEATFLEADSWKVTLKTKVDTGGVLYKNGWWDYSNYLKFPAGSLIEFILPFSFTQTLDFSKAYPQSHSYITLVKNISTTETNLTWKVDVPFGYLLNTWTPKSYTYKIITPDNKTLVNSYFQIPGFPTFTDKNSCLPKFVL